MKKTVNLFEVARENTSKIRSGDSADSTHKNLLNLSSIGSHIKTYRKENEQRSEIGLSTLLDFSVSTVHHNKKVTENHKNRNYLNDDPGKNEARV